MTTKVAQLIGENHGLQQWTSALFTSTGSKSAAGKLVPVNREKITTEDVKRELLKVLLEVYICDGCVLMFCLVVF